LLNDVVPYIVTAITGIASYFVGLKRRKKEVDSVEIDNLKKTIVIQQQSIDFLGKRVDVLQKQFYDCMKKVKND
jgi:hypothetical protein